MALVGPSRAALRSLLPCARRGYASSSSHSPSPTAAAAARLGLRFGRPTHSPVLARLRPHGASTSSPAALAFFSTSTAAYLPRTRPDESSTWASRMAAREMEQEATQLEREAKESTWNQYGRREPIRSWWRPIVFTAGFSYLAFITAATYTNMDVEEWMDKLGAGSISRFGGWPSDNEMIRAKRLLEAKSAQETLKTLPSVLSFLPNFILVPILRTYIMCKEAQINSRDSYHAQVEIIFVLSALFVCWKLKSFQPLMTRWFLHNPVAWTKREDWRNSFTMLTSTFSHQTLPHFAFNSIALFSFGSAAYHYLDSQDPELPILPTIGQNAHFFAFIAVAGVFAGLGSHLVSNLVRLPRLIRSLRSPVQLSPTHALAAHHALHPSLGASGAIYACVTMTALAYPDSNVSLIFLPMFAIPMPVGVLGMVAVDIFGVIRGWRHFDHFAHLAGALFGVFYYFEGKKIWTWIRIQCGAEPRPAAFHRF